MLIFEPADCLYWTQYNYPNIVILNLDSDEAVLKYNIPKMKLSVPDEIIRLEPSQQELYFNDYIISNDSMFLSLMRIITLLYNGDDVVITTYSDSLLYDLLSNFIQNRYGYNCIIVNEPEDIMVLNLLTENDKGSFSLQGLSFLDSDNSRYAYLCTMMQINPNIIIEV